MRTGESIELNEFMRRERAKMKEPYKPRMDEILMSTKEYAARVGQTPEAITQQLRKGFLTGVQLGTRWMVLVKDPRIREENEEIARLRKENDRLRAALDVIRGAVLAGEENVV